MKLPWRIKGDEPTIIPYKSPGTVSVPCPVCRMPMKVVSVSADQIKDVDDRYACQQHRATAHVVAYR